MKNAGGFDFEGEPKDGRILSKENVSCLKNIETKKFQK